MAGIHLHAEVLPQGPLCRFRPGGLLGDHRLRILAVVDGGSLVAFPGDGLGNQLCFCERVPKFVCSLDRLLLPDRLQEGFIRGIPILGGLCVPRLPLLHGLGMLLRDLVDVFDLCGVLDLGLELVGEDRRTDLFRPEPVFPLPLLFPDDEVIQHLPPLRCGIFWPHGDNVGVRDRSPWGGSHLDLSLPGTAEVSGPPEPFFCLCETLAHRLFAPVAAGRDRRGCGGGARGGDGRRGRGRGGGSNGLPRGTSRAGDLRHGTAPRSSQNTPSAFMSPMPRQPIRRMNPIAMIWGFS